MRLRHREVPRRLSGMVVLVRALTRCAPVCRGMRFQTLALDRLPAAYADAVCAQRYPLQSALDRTDLLHIARDFGQIDFEQKVRERLILEIADASGDIRMGFVVGPR